MTDFSLIDPVFDAVSEPWFKAVSDDRLLIQRDPITGKAFFYPRARVPRHPEREPLWLEACGRGKLHTFTVVERSVHPEFAALTPFVLAIVDLEEGPRMTSWIVDTPADEITCDMAVRVVFREIYPGRKMPCFVKA